jgi:hypothetical protein
MALAVLYFICSHSPMQGKLCLEHMLELEIPGPAVSKPGLF